MAPQSTSSLRPLGADTPGSTSFTHHLLFMMSGEVLEIPGFCYNRLADFTCHVWVKTKRQENISCDTTISADTPVTETEPRSGKPLVSS